MSHFCRCKPPPAQFNLIEQAIPVLLKHISVFKDENQQNDHHEQIDAAPGFVGGKNYGRPLDACWASKSKNSKNF